MPTDQEIRQLCFRVISAQVPEQFQASLDELRLALRDYFTEVENKGIQMLLDMRKKAAANQR